MTDHSVWVYGEARDGRLTSGTRELISCAATLGAATVVLFGARTEEAAEDAGRHGATAVLVDPNAAYDEHLTTPVVEALDFLIRERGPRVLMFGGSYHGRDVASRLAARLDCGIIANATEIERSGEDYVVTTPWGERTIATCQLTFPGVRLVLFRSQAFAAEEKQSRCEVERFQLTLSAEAKTVRIVETVEEESEGPSLSDAGVVVSGGRGLGDAESFHKVEELAQLLGGAVGASRGAVDAGWRPAADLVGQSGTTVKPSVYIACGISGAVQHMTGMKNAKVIAAINRDPDAPIFRSADLGIIGDVNKILPQLIEEVRRRKER